MKLKTFGFGTMVAAAVVGATVAVAPAQAATLSAGQALNLFGDSRLEIAAGGNSLKLNFDDNMSLTAVNYSTPTGKAIVTGSSDSVYGPGTIAVLKDLNLVKSGSSFVLGAAVNSFITLTNGIKFNLQSFILKGSGVGPGGLAKWDADYTGEFVSDNSVDGVGVFTTQGKVTSTKGSSFSSTVIAIPTPALLPGLVGLGVAALRKRKSESELEAAETAKA